MPLRFLPKLSQRTLCFWLPHTIMFSPSHTLWLLCMFIYATLFWLPALSFFRYAFPASQHLHPLFHTIMFSPVLSGTILHYSIYAPLSIPHLHYPIPAQHFELSILAITHYIAALCLGPAGFILLSQTILFLSRLRIRYFNILCLQLSISISRVIPHSPIFLSNSIRIRYCHTILFPLALAFAFYFAIAFTHPISMLFASTFLLLLLYLSLCCRYDFMFWHYILASYFWHHTPSQYPISMLPHTILASRFPAFVSVFYCCAVPFPYCCAIVLGFDAHVLAGLAFSGTTSISACAIVLFGVSLCFFLWFSFVWFGLG
jgi:hypothetical protein